MHRNFSGSEVNAAHDKFVKKTDDYNINFHTQDLKQNYKESNSL